MKRLVVCKKCGKYLKGKRWLSPEPGMIERARAMERLELSLCSFCTRDPLTHNAILQVKGMPPEEVEKIISEELSRAENERVFEKGGHYHFTSKSLARAVARRLKDKGAVLKETSKIVTYDPQRSRQLTRLTISAKFPFSPGDIVEYRGRKYLVSKLSKGFVFSQSGAKFPIKDAKKLESTRKKGFYISRNLVFVEDTGETVEVEQKGEGEVEIIESGNKKWIKKL